MEVLVLDLVYVVRVMFIKIDQMVGQIRFLNEIVFFSYDFSNPIVEQSEGAGFFEIFHKRQVSEWWQGAQRYFTSRHIEFYFKKI